MNITIEQLKNLIMKYDVFNGEYPESMYEGLSVYEFILQELGIPSDIPNDRFNIEYFNLMQKTFKKNNNESTT